MLNGNVTVMLLFDNVTCHPGLGPGAAGPDRPDPGSCRGRLRIRGKQAGRGRVCQRLWRRLTISWMLSCARHADDGHAACAEHGRIREDA